MQCSLKFLLKRHFNGGLTILKTLSSKTYVCIVLGTYPLYGNQYSFIDTSLALVDIGNVDQHSCWLKDIESPDVSFTISFQKMTMQQLPGF